MYLDFSWVDCLNGRGIPILDIKEGKKHTEGYVPINVSYS